MRGKKVVSNSGPLMALAKLNRLSVLKKLYQEVLIPQAVYEEAVVRGMTQGYPDALAIKLFLEQQGWQAVYVDHEGISQDLLKERLDWGEIESIELLFAQIELRDDIWITPALCKEVLRQLKSRRM